MAEVLLTKKELENLPDYSRELFFKNTVATVLMSSGKTQSVPLPKLKAFVKDRQDVKEIKIPGYSNIVVE